MATELVRGRIAVACALLAIGLFQPLTRFAAAESPESPEAKSAVRGRAQIEASKLELFVGDAGESVVFYRALGFEVAHTKSYGYTTLAAGRTTVALSPVPGWARFPLWLLSWLRCPPLGTEIVLYTDDLEAARAALLGAGYEPGDIQLQSWGDRDFRITDPDGYYIRVSLGAAIPRPSAPETPPLN